MSVDRSYDSFDPEEAKKRALQILKKQKVDWPSAFDPAGWAGVHKAFNSSGYGLVLVDPKGIVRGIGVRADRAEALLKEIFPK